MSDTRLGSGSEATEACSGGEFLRARDDVFECPYCEEVFASESERDVCHSSHFEGSDGIVRKGSRDKDYSIIEDYKENVGGEA